MGALAGGAAGAFGGHQMGHGVLGAVGGAIGGSMLEDVVKKKKGKGQGKPGKQHKQKQGKRRGSKSSSGSSSSSSSSDSDHHKRKGTVPVGNFRASSLDVRLEGKATLVCECADIHGHHRRSSLDLNHHLSNHNGTLKWSSSGGFAGSAKHIGLANDGKRLEVELRDDHGEWQQTWVSLNRRITNDDGKLVLL